MCALRDSGQNPQGLVEGGSLVHKSVNRSLQFRPRIQSGQLKMAVLLYYLSPITNNLGRSYAIISTLQLRKDA